MRPDQDVLASLIPEGSRVLDLGCGDGALLKHLMETKGCSGQGVEVSTEAFHAAVARGIPVVQADIDAGLPDFADRSFDVVVLSQTLQSVYRPNLVMREVMRVGRRGIVSFPNFGHWQVRVKLLLGGRMPVTKALPNEWHETPNIRHCTISDFERLVMREGPWQITERRYLDGAGNAANGLTKRAPNLLAAGAVFALG
ncbi:MAG: methionine biosynthesis protein MetW [Thermoleophilia bacterium]|nr:methionine biosynthesis protein MetW [Thermoleophilia bacterium]MDH3725029.1 methionine biosynthesis protein MetW [Thermoleophilia bacterium]